MDYGYTRIWKVEHKLIIADTIEEAIEVYKTWVKSMGGVTSTDITDIKAIGDSQIPENFDALIKKGIVEDIFSELKEPENEKKGKSASKFHKGDWIVGHNVVCQILAIYIGGYIVDKDNCELFIPFENEELYHLWSIEDAKDGDVLTAHECYVIFKEIDGLNIKCYCTYHYMNNSSFHVNTLHNKMAFYPATKEQENLLFTKMEENGYKWNSKEKRLVKIPKPKEAEGVLKELLDEMKEQIETIESENKGKEREIYPNSWTEEDEHRLNDTIHFLDTAKKHYASTEELDTCIEWLKMIKLSVGYNPYKAAINSIAEMCEKYEFKGEMARDFLNNIKAKCKDAKQYEEIHFQNMENSTKKQMFVAWSEEDKRIMSAISQLLKDCESENDWNCVYSNDREVFFVDIEKWLQSIKERAVWKPSEEQLY